MYNLQQAAVAVLGKLINMHMFIQGHLYYDTHITFLLPCSHTIYILESHTGLEKSLSSLEWIEFRKYLDLQVTTHDKSPKKITSDTVQLVRTSRQLLPSLWLLEDGSSRQKKHCFWIFTSRPNRCHAPRTVAKKLGGARLFCLNPSSFINKMPAGKRVELAQALEDSPQVRVWN